MCACFRVCSPSKQPSTQNARGHETVQRTKKKTCARCGMCVQRVFGPIQYQYGVWWSICARMCVLEPHTYKLLHCIVDVEWTTRARERSHNIACTSYARCIECVIMFATRASASKNASRLFIAYLNHHLGYLYTLCAGPATCRNPHQKKTQQQQSLLQRSQQRRRRQPKRRRAA